MNNYRFTKNLYLLFFVGLFMVACEKEVEVEETWLPANKEHKLTDISYGTDERNIMDVYLPANRTTETPLIILIHGGAWIAGDKSIFTSMQDTLMARGIASVNMNYRYVSAAVHNEQLMEDIDKVVKYCIDNADYWQSRKSKIMIGGHSAGGHLSLMYGYTADTRGAIGGIIAVSAPTNLYDEQLLKMATLVPQAIQTLEQLADAKYVYGEPVHENFKKISPITRIKNVPTLLIHGTNDELVLYSSILAFETELKNKNVPYKLHSVQGANHSFSNINTETSSKMNAEIVNWINTYGK